MARRAIVALLAVSAAGLLFASSVEWLRPAAKRNALQIARVTRGTIESTMQANGTVVPLVEQVVSSPLEARVTRIARRPGDAVQPGDELLVLDTGQARLEAEQFGERVGQRENDLAQLRLRLDEGLATLEAQLEQRRLDSEILHYTASQKQKLRVEGLTAEQDALAAETSAKKSDIEVRHLVEAVKRARVARDTQLAAAGRDVTIARREREESKRQLELAMLRAQRAGVVTWAVAEEGATVRRGEVVARIADLSSFRVAATISDVHAARLAAGMPAHVTAGDVVIDGTIESVDPRIEQGVVRFYVILDQPSHARLRNNLRVDVEIVTGRKESALVTRRGALGRTNTSEAFVVRGEKAVRVPVRFGLAATDAIEIVDGLREGDQVVITDMNEFEGVDEVRLR